MNGRGPAPTPRRACSYRLISGIRSPSSIRSGPLCAILAPRFRDDRPKVPGSGLLAGSGHLGHDCRDDCRGSQQAQRQLGVVSVFGVHADLPTAVKGGWWVSLEGGEIPTAADERSACPRRVTGRGDRDGRLTRRRRRLWRAQRWRLLAASPGAGLFVTFSPTACEDGERHDLSAGS